MEKTMILSQFASHEVAEALPPSTYLSKVGLDDLSTLEEQWYYFLKHAEESNSIAPPIAANKTIREAYDLVERFNWTPQELINYDRNMMAICDDVSRYYGAKEEGRQEGRQEGAQQKSLDIARYFFLRGMPLAQIAEAVGVPETELESLLSVTSTLQLFSPTA